MKVLANGVCINKSKEKDKNKSLPAGQCKVWSRKFECECWKIVIKFKVNLDFQCLHVQSWVMTDWMKRRCG